MPKPQPKKSLNAFIEVRCQCGYPHTLLRDEVLDGLVITRWKCAACKRRFVVACTPGGDGRADTFWPIFLDQVPSTGSTIEGGVSQSDADPSKVPDEIHFQCRCGCRLVGRSGMLGHSSRCPRCDSRLVLRLGYKNGSQDPIPMLEFVAEGGSAGAGGGRE